MAVYRFIPAVLLFAVLSNVASAVQFTPSFEKGLSERYAAIIAYDTAHPRNAVSVAYTWFETSCNVSNWQWRSVDECTRKLQQLADINKKDTEYLHYLNPAYNDITDTLSKYFTEFIEFFNAGIQTGDVFEVATTSPPARTTSPPPQLPPLATRTSMTPRMTSEAGSGSSSGKEEAGAVRFPYSITPVTMSPFPVDRRTWSPSTTSSVQRVDEKLSLWVIPVLFVAGMLSVLGWVFQMIRSGERRRTYR